MDEKKEERQKKVREYGYKNRTYIRVNVSNDEMEAINTYLSEYGLTISPYIKSLINANMEAHGLPIVFMDKRRKKLND